MIKTIWRKLRGHPVGASAQPAAVVTSGLALYHFKACPYCVRVRRIVRRLNLDLPLRDIHKNPEHHADLVAGGGRQTVPCLRIEEAGGVRWMYESADIVRYLQQRFSTSQPAA